MTEQRPSKERSFAEIWSVSNLVKRLREFSDGSNYGSLEDLQEALIDLADDLNGGAFALEDCVDPCHITEPELASALHFLQDDLASMDTTELAGEVFARIKDQRHETQPTASKQLADELNEMREELFADMRPGVELLDRTVAFLRASHEPSDDALTQIDDLLQTMIVSAEVFTDADRTVTGYKIKTGALHKIVGLRSHLFFPQNMKEAERASEPPAGRDNPNEGPIGGHGFVEVSDGVLPAFHNHWSCSQCGRRAEYVKENGCPESCGRTALTKDADPGQEVKP